jgi:hypothetical protein
VLKCDAKCDILKLHKQYKPYGQHRYILTIHTEKILLIVAFSTFDEFFILSTLTLSSSGHHAHVHDIEPHARNWHISRVTRLGEFLPFVWLLSWVVCENYRSSLNLCATLSSGKSDVLSLTKKGLSYILGDFLQTHLVTLPAQQRQGGLLLMWTGGDRKKRNLKKKF